MNQAKFTENHEHRTMTVERAFDAPVEKVWAAWTTQAQLEKWWAPAPYKARTKSFDFRVGGRWLYYMESPEGERHWCVVDYEAIEPYRRFSGFDGFCDEEGNRNAEMPGMDWINEFDDRYGRTEVRITIQFVSVEDMKRIVEMGFKEGFTTGLNQLEQMLCGD